MCESYRKCILNDGYATVIGKGSLGCEWFPSIHFFDKNGKFVAYLESKQTQLFYRALRTTFVMLGNKGDKDLLYFEWLGIKYKFVIIDGFIYLTTRDSRKPQSGIFIDEPVAIKLLRAIEEIA